MVASIAYCWRRESVGSRLAARRAGMQQAKTAAPISVADTVSRITGSPARTPYGSCENTENHSVEGQRRRQSDHHAGYCQPKALTDHHPQNFGPRSAKRHSDADFLHTAGRRIGNHTKDPDESEHQRQNREDHQKQHRKALPSHRSRNQFRPGPDISPYDHRDLATEDSRRVVGKLVEGGIDLGFLAPRAVEPVMIDMPDDTDDLRAHILAQRR